MRRPIKRSKPRTVAAPSAPKPENLDALEATLQYSFEDRSLLRMAVTHQSALESAHAEGESYQRLEFLGDRVLGLAVSQMLFRLQPQIVVGRLARRLSDLVRAETCADIAEVWGLGDHILFGQNTGKDTRQSRSVLADVCEAILGAIFLDGGAAEATRVVERFWAPLLNETGVALQDAKTSLQEWVQARGLQPPNYTDLDRSGPDHDPVFTVRVEVPGFENAEAQASAKKIAQQCAAEAFLLREGIWTTGSKFSRKNV